ncbi:MAG: hypothetical protein QOD76_388, partial [Solirubrobacteraceae bacterium]|nr:hypothetical protein [Solirubrobacteraceae bacterium]
MREAVTVIRMRAPWGTPAGLAALLVALVVPAGASAAPTFGDPDFAYQPLVAGLPRPTAAAWTPDGRMLIATKDGKVFVGTPNGSGLPSLNPNPIIDISSQVNSYSDRGLLGIAVDSAYGTNHYVYLLYTHEPGGNSQDTAPKSS